MKLSEHFKLVIKEIVQGTFKQLPTTSEITKELVNKKKKTYYFSAKDCETLWRIPSNVECRWLGERHIRRKLLELRNKVLYSSNS